MVTMQNALLFSSVASLLVLGCTTRSGHDDAGNRLDAAADGRAAADAEARDAALSCEEPLECSVEECWIAAAQFCGSSGAFCGPLAVHPQGTSCAGGAGVCYTGPWLPGDVLQRFDGAVNQWSSCRLTNQRSCRGEVVEALACGFGGCSDGSLCGAVVGGDETFDLGSPDAVGAIPIVPGVQVGALEMDRMEVNVARFRAFWNADDRVPTEPIRYPDGREIVWRGELREPNERADDDDVYNWSPVADVSSRESHPVNGVDWWTALAFCVWDGGRLPTEAEWEYFARIREDEEQVLRRGRTYAWGEHRSSDTERCHEGIYRNCRLSTAEPWPHSDVVHSRETSVPSHMSGNVAEWTADAFRAYDDACWSGPDRGNWCAPDGSDTEGRRTVRGGSYASPEELVRTASRQGFDALTQSAEIGFRCVREHR